jgi:twitching motility two-component system response regulator PilH
MTGKKILIVDDSVFQRNRVKRVLAQYDYEILEGSDGHAALEMVAAHTPDCMLLDLLMPDMDGWKVLAALRERGMQIPVIVLTADIQESTREQCLELGAVAVLTKPFSNNELREIIGQVVERGKEMSNGCH